MIILQGVEEEVKEEQIHSYVIEAFVLRDSWPLTRKEWDFAENHKNVDRIEKESKGDFFRTSEKCCHN